MRTQLVELLAQVADTVVAVLFGVPTRFQPVELFAFVGDFLVQIGETVLGAVVQFRFGLFRGLVVLRIAQQVRLLHLETVHLAAQFVDFLRRGVEFHAQVRCGLVHQIDGLVRQLASGNVAVRQGCRRDQRVVADGHLVVGLILRRDAAQDGDGVLHARLADEHLLETTFERRILFDVLTVFVQCGGADQAQFATGQHGLEHIARVHGAFGRARADDGVDLVDEGDDLPVGLLDLLKHALQTFLEFATVLGTSHHGAQVKRDKLLVLQGGRHVAGDDALRQAFDDGGFADARLADQHRIVLGTAGQDLDDAADFLVTADHRVELAFLRGGRQIGGVLLQSFIRAFRVGAGHLAVAAARGGQGVTQLIRGKTVLFQDVRALIRFRGRDCDQHEVDGDVLVSPPLHFFFGLR